MLLPPGLLEFPFEVVNKLTSLADILRRPGKDQHYQGRSLLITRWLLLVKDCAMVLRGDSVVMQDQGARLMI